MGEIRIMNERIQQLAMQAGLYVYTYQGTSYPSALSAEECEIAYEKFAKLIVKECVNISNEYDLPKMSGPGMIIGGIIEDYFGFEE